MRLESARDLKNEILATYADAKCGIKRVAIGITPPIGGRGSRIAVRLYNPTLVDRLLVQHIARLASGEVDIREVYAVTLADAGAFLPPARRDQVLKIGSSVSHYLGSAGTLGFFAARSREAAVGLVSCNHVIAAEDFGEEGDEILHPGKRDGGSRPADIIAHLDGTYLKLHGRQVEADCAFARIAEGISFDPARLSTHEVLRSEVASPAEIETVEKIGRTTGRTIGRISAFDLDFFVHYRLGPVMLRSQLEIESTSDYPFALAGDSGALVFTSDLRPLALLNATCPFGGQNHAGLAYAAPLDRVLRLLELQLITG